MRLLLPALLFLLAMIPPASLAGGQAAALQARITITSQCSAQPVLFGPRALSSATVVCQPGATPFHAQAIHLNGLTTDSPADTGLAAAMAGDGASAQGVGGAPIGLSTKKMLSPPLPSSAIFASKVIYVVF